jgi:enoyl-CoA hydratase/carnithine racemase
VNVLAADDAGNRRQIDDRPTPIGGMAEARRIVFRMLECDKPIIARVNGHAVGLGVTVALLCDIIIAADHAKIGDPHVNAGLVAGDGGALIWPQLIGFARAKEYLFTGDLMTAAEAERIGLINHRPAFASRPRFTGVPRVRHLSGNDSPSRHAQRCRICADGYAAVGAARSRTDRASADGRAAPATVIIRTCWIRAAGSQ